MLLNNGQFLPDVIYARDSSLRVNVYHLHTTDFLPDMNELQLYTRLPDAQLLAFETVKLNPEDAINLITAIRWYANYIGFPDLEISADDPRPYQVQRESLSWRN